MCNEQEKIWKKEVAKQLIKKKRKAEKKQKRRVGQKIIDLVLLDAKCSMPNA